MWALVVVRVWGIIATELNQVSVKKKRKKEKKTGKGKTDTFKANGREMYRFNVIEYLLWNAHT